MTDRWQYAPGPASGAQVRKDGETWTLILVGRMVGTEVMNFGGWQRLNAEYAKQFGGETPGLPTNDPKP